MKRILFFSVLVSACFGTFVAQAAPELKGSPNELTSFLHPAEKIISIHKNAEKTAFKDIAIVSLVVTTQEDELALALKKNSELRQKISTTLKNKGIAGDAINNAKFSTAPDYGWFGDKPDSYKASNTLTIRIASESQLESVAKIVDEYKEVSLQKTEYEHSKKDDFLKQVAEEALDKVLAQKAFYETKLGIELEVDSFFTQDAYVESSQPLRHNRIEKRATLSTLDQEQAYSSQPVNTSFEKLVYRATVTVNFTVK